jgi:hypothetical protein
MASVDFTNKIGYVPNLSLEPPATVPKHTQRLNRGDRTMRYDHVQQSQSQKQQPQPVATHVTSANATISTSPRPNINNFGEFGQPSSQTKASTLPSKQPIRDDSALPPRPREKEPARPSTATNTASDTTSTTAQTARLTVTNQNADDGAPSWLSATEEKLRLKQSDPQNGSAAPAAPTPKPSTTSSQSKWLSAEEEKRRMFEQAQKRVTVTQNQLNVGSQTPVSS